MNIKLTGIKSLLSLSLIMMFYGAYAQKFAAPAMGYFEIGSTAKVMLEDSSLVTYTVDSMMMTDDDYYPESFYFKNNSGESIELFPDEILYLEIIRGDEPEMVDLDDEDLDDEDEYVEVDVIETTKVTDKIVYERVELSNDGLKLKGDYKEDFLLLQLASVGMGDSLKAYVWPNFDEGGTEVAPLGKVSDKIARNRIDLVEIQENYFIKSGSNPAILIDSETYIDYAPLIFRKSRTFRRKYSVEKFTDGESTKKRKKTSRKKVGSKREKASLLKYQDLADHIIDFHKLYTEDLEAAEKKRLEREAARNSRN